MVKDPVLFRRIARNSPFLFGHEHEMFAKRARTGRPVTFATKNGNQSSLQ